MRQVEAAEAQQKLEQAQQVQISALVSRGRDALAAGRREEAGRLAQQALAVDAENDDARALQADAARQPRRHSAAPTPAIPAAEAPAPAEAAAPATDPTARGPAHVKIHFFTQVSEGVLTIYADKHQIMREPFSFFKRTSLLHSEPKAGVIDAERRLEPGPTTLRVYVALKGGPPRMTTVEDDLAPGSERLLEIEMSADGSLQARLQ